MSGSIDPADQRRRETRTGVIKRAKIVFGRSVIDCVVLDVSPGGARVRTEVVVSMPEQVVLRFSGGSAYVAQLQWALGTELGYRFDGLAPLAEDVASLALSAFNALPANDLEAPMRLLRSARFFDDPALTRAAEDAEAAYARFKAALKARITFQV
jgi:PilZ domain